MKKDFIRVVCAYVEQHMGENVTAQDIAAAAGLHPSYCNTRFHAVTGMCLKQYIHLCKTQQAQRLLRETARPISEIGTMLGYFDQSHFTRVFKNYAGMTPAQYRRQQP